MPALLIDAATASPRRRVVDDQSVNVSDHRPARPRPLDLPIGTEVRVEVELEPGGPPLVVDGPPRARGRRDEKGAALREISRAGPAAPRALHRRAPARRAADEPDAADDKKTKKDRSGKDAEKPRRTRGRGSIRLAAHPRASARSVGAAAGRRACAAWPALVASSPAARRCDAGLPLFDAVARGPGGGHDRRALPAAGSPRTLPRGLAPPARSAELGPRTARRSWPPRERERAGASARRPPAPPQRAPPDGRRAWTSVRVRKRSSPAGRGRSPRL